MKNWRGTIYASYLGYVTQAVINNLAPLCFLIFQESFSISLSQITLLTTVNFLVQLVVDLASTRVVDRIGYRPCIVAAHGFAAAGLILLSVLPRVMADAYAGLLIAVVIYALGGGLIEVLISPIVEACPTDDKVAAMSLLHSFYCWGTVAVVLLSTLFLAAFGKARWYLLPLVWAVLPIANGIFFTRVPIASLTPEGDGMHPGALLKSGTFWVLALMMFAAGSSEQAMSQWASAFAEGGLQVSKTVGDIAGPCFFSVMMGLSRAIYGKLGEKFPLRLAMPLSGGLCVIAYLMAALLKNPVLALFGCGLCGFSVGILWPGTFSLSAKALPKGGTAMFALLALFGDLGCSGGPTAVGFVADACGGRLAAGLLAAIAFPVTLIVLSLLQGRSMKNE